MYYICFMKTIKPKRVSDSNEFLLQGSSKFNLSTFCYNSKYILVDQEIPFEPMENFE